jgi:uncharacterized protein YceK
MTKQSDIKYKLVFWGFLLFVMICFFCSSCSSIRKLKTNVKTTEQVKTTDSSGTSKEAAESKEKTSSTTSTTTTTSGKKITITYDSSHKDSGTAVKISSKDGVIDIKSNGKIKSIEVEEEETDKQQIKSDSTEKTESSLKTNDTKKGTTEKQTTTVVKNKQVEKTGFQWWKIVLPIVIILIILLVLWGAFGITPVALLKRIKSLFTKNKNMKNLILVVTIATLFSSCWNWDKPTPPRELANGVYNEEREPVYDSVFVWNVAAKQYVKEWGIARYKVVPIKEMEVVPSGKQVMKFSYFAGYGWLQLIGLILIAAFVYTLIALHISNDEKLLRKAKLRIGKFATSIEVSTRGHAVAIIRGLGVLLIIALGFLTLHPGAIAQNNAKTITEKQLKHYQAIDPELNYFWDSVYKAGGITTIKQPK